MRTAKVPTCGSASSVILEHHDPAQAVAELEALLELVNAPGIWGQLERTALHHALGNRFQAMLEGPAIEEEQSWAVRVKFPLRFRWTGFFRADNEAQDHSETAWRRQAHSQNRQC